MDKAQEKIEEVIADCYWPRYGSNTINPDSSVRVEDATYSKAKQIIIIIEELGYRKPSDRPEVCKDCPTFEKVLEKLLWMRFVVRMVLMEEQARKSLSGLRIFWVIMMNGLKHILKIAQRDKWYSISRMK